ncbi:MAG: XdhC family protein [Acidimicrobiia bacterium]|nr:XdhC family protein [Acidimicrobiia bacterium]
MSGAGGPMLLEAAALVAAREPFVLVSVVWRRGPSSGHVGSTAIVRADGSVQGWIGGACAEPSMISRALECLGTSRSELVFLGPPDEADERGHSSSASVPMACDSDGALEVFLEPIVPSLRLVVVGRSPAVDAMAAMGRALGWDAWIVDDGGRADEHPNPDIVRTKLELDLVTDRGCAVVVATQGHYDDLALAAALATPAGYIGLVASERRAATVLDHLRADGHRDDDLARIDAPAGLDLGPTENVEIAAAVIAELVTRRTRGDLQPDDARRPTGPTAAIDPVCGMTVDPSSAKYHAMVDGVDYWFCASSCKREFEQIHQ